MRILCVLGKYQYGDPLRGESAEYMSFPPAFKRLGHEVRHFEAQDMTKKKDLIALNLELIDVVEQFKPEAIFAVQDGYEIWIETWQYIAQNSQAILINWTTDDSWKYVKLSKYVSFYFDVMTTTYPSAAEKYKRDGYLNVFLTQWAASAETLQTPLPAQECLYPVTFIGTAHGDRKEKMAYLKQNGIEVYCVGHGWSRGAVSSAEMSAIVRQSVISLNFANSQGVNQIKARNFEILGLGGFLLTEDAPHLDQFLVPEREIIVFEDMADACKKIKFYLANPDKRDVIAQAGYAKVVTEHTYDQRMAKLLDFAGAVDRLHTEARTLEKKIDMNTAVAAHTLNPFQKILRNTLLKTCTLIWGQERGPRAARRFVFEVSLLVHGQKTFSSQGWPGRLFPGI